MSSTYIAISVIALAIIAAVVIYRHKKSQKKMSKLGTFAFLLIILGIVFGEDITVGYSFIGTGVVLAVIDIIKNLKKQKT